jgi:hypothetical protein
MAKRDWTPEERAELRRMRDEALASRQQLQEAWDNLREKWRLADERRERRRALMRRIARFGRAA